MREHPEPPAPPRLMTFLTANSLEGTKSEELRIQLTVRSEACLKARKSRKEAKMKVQYKKLLSVLESINRLNYQNYLKDGTHRMIEKIEPCGSYIELNTLFTDKMYEYASYASEEQLAQAFAAFLNQGSVLLARHLAENRRLLWSEKELARCIDMYRGVITGQISLPIPYSVPLHQYQDPTHLGGYEWLQHFLRNVTPGWMIRLQFSLLETGRLAHRTYSLAKAREMTPMINRGTLRRDRNASQFRRIDPSLVRVIACLAFPILLSKSDVDLDRVVKVDLAECELTRPFDQY